MIKGFHRAPQQRHFCRLQRTHGERQTTQSAEQPDSLLLMPVKQRAKDDGQLSKLHGPRELQAVTLS